MSVKNVQKFAERITTDRRLRAKVRAARTEQEMIELGKGHGFSFSSHDLRVFDARLDAAAGVISEEELERVASRQKLGHSLGVTLTEKKTCGTPCCTIEPGVKPRRRK